MLVQPLVDRLINPALLRQVGGATEYGAALAGSPPAPCVFVLGMGDDAPAEAPHTSGVQPITRRYGVVQCVRNVRDASGSAATADLQAVRAWVLGQLLGWEPAAERAAFEPLQFARGRLLDFDAGTLWWQDDFTTVFMSSRLDAWT